MRLEENQQNLDLRRSVCTTFYTHTQEKPFCDRWGGLRCKDQEQSFKVYQVHDITQEQAKKMTKAMKASPMLVSQVGRVVRELVDELND